MEKLQKLVSINLFSLLGYIIIGFFIYNLKDYDSLLGYLSVLGINIRIVLDLLIVFRILFAIFLIEIIFKWFMKKKYNKIFELNINNKIYNFLFRLGIFFLIIPFLTFFNLCLTLGIDALFNIEILSDIMYYLPFVIVGIIIFKK